MSGLVRFSFSIEKELLEAFQNLIDQKQYQNRSEYVRDLLREKITESKISKDKIVVGTIFLIYDHHKRDLGKKLTQVQHEHHDVIIATTHVHLTHYMCAEAIIAKGKYSVISSIANQVGKQKGVIHSSLSIGMVL
ncbi:MAG: nickel-responsive transcriptional regulator NikR [Oligoflexia bacterium]|nr:nickel-responsive transcriptional regulator NikR [Oligoflexia bacterium]